MDVGCCRPIDGNGFLFLVDDDCPGLIVADFSRIGSSETGEGFLFRKGLGIERKGFRLLSVFEGGGDDRGCSDYPLLDFL